MDTQNTEPRERPLGYWLKAADRLMAAEFARAFENEGITRREWRLLNAVDGTVAPGHRLDERKLGRLIDLGWVAPSDDGWTLTDDGHAAKERLGALVDGIRTTVSDAVTPEDYATTIATLEQIARALGWDENTPLPAKPHGRHRGHGHPGFTHGFGRRGRGFPHAPEHDEFPPHHGGRFGADRAHHDGHGCRGHHRDHESMGLPNHDEHARPHPGQAHRRFARFAQHTYERGFDAGFDRGRTTR